MLKYRPIILLLVLGLILRFSYIIFIYDPSDFKWSDMANYIKMASDIQNNNWSEGLFFQPIGFPLILVFIERVFGGWSFPLGMIQALVSTFTLFFMWKASFETWGEKVAKYALILGIFHVSWIIMNGFALAETFFAFFLSLLLFLGQRIFQNSAQQVSTSILWGLAFLAAFWMKGSHVFMGPLFLMAILFYFRKQSLLKTIVPISVVVGLGLFAHGTFTQKKTGKFLISSSAGGLNFVEGKCPDKRNIDSRGIHWLSPLYYHLHLKSEKKWDVPFTDSSYFMKAGLECIEKNPAVLLTSLEGIPYLFFGNYMFPGTDMAERNLIRYYELLFTLFLVPGLLIYLIINWGKLSAEEIITWCVPVIALFTCVYIFKSEIRFRIPFDIFFIPMAVRGWLQLKNSQAHIQPL
jgi:hypothetical protein